MVSHEKSTLWSVQTEKTKISLHICAVLLNFPFLFMQGYPLYSTWRFPDHSLIFYSFPQPFLWINIIFIQL